jgi:hypothetical protein
MVIYLVGDVLRIFSSDFIPGGIEGVLVGQALWLGIAGFMLIPILLVFLSLALKYKLNRRTNIIVAVFLFIFNIAGLPTYPGWYDRFLIVVSLVFNVLTAGKAWKWQEEEPV